MTLETEQLVAERFFIGGEAIDVSDRTAARHTLESPVTETPLGTVIHGTPEDVDKAVKAAREALAVYRKTTVDERVALMQKFRDLYALEVERLAQLVTTEVGSPITFSRNIQAGSTLIILDNTIKALKEFKFSEMTEGGSLIVKEPIGVCGLITPWNFPIHQIITKVAGALAAGCTIVLKPSELSPFSADAFAELFHRAGFPAGVFNVVHGDGPTVGNAISTHPGIDMVSFTGSTRAGVLIAKAAADTVKRVHQELGGKSPAIMLPDADIQPAIDGTLSSHLSNTGQACVAWSRFLVPEDLHDEVAEATKVALEKKVIGSLHDDATQLGAISTKPQYEKIQEMIDSGIKEGATLMTGGLGRPNKMQRGYFVKPTLFSNVTPEMTIAQEEIFGPVLAIMPYKSVEHAIEIANNSAYGLSAGVFSRNLDTARKVASEIQSGMVHINGAWFDFDTPFGGMKQSGNGREWGKFGMEDFLDVKAIMGYEDGVGNPSPH